MASISKRVTASTDNCSDTEDGGSPGYTDSTNTFHGYQSPRPLAAGYRILSVGGIEGVVDSASFEVVDLNFGSGGGVQTEVYFEKTGASPGTFSLGDSPWDRVQTTASVVFDYTATNQEVLTTSSLVVPLQEVVDAYEPLTHICVTVEGDAAGNAHDLFGYDTDSAKAGLFVATWTPDAGGEERSAAGVLPAMAGSVARVLSAFRSPAGTLPAMAGTVTRLLSASRSVSGVLPAMAGVISSIKTTFATAAGILPAMAGTVSSVLVTTRNAVGTLPAMSGTVSRILTALRNPVGVLPSMTGTVTRSLSAFRTAGGTLPAMGGVATRILTGLRSIAGTIPAMSGTVSSDSIAPIAGTITLTLLPRDTTLTLEGRGILIEGAVFPLAFPIYLDGSHVGLSLRERDGTLTLEGRP